MTVEVIPDRMGVEFLRELAAGIERHLDEQAGAVVEIPFAIPDKLDHTALVELADAIDEMGVLDAEPVPAFKLRRFRFKVLP